MLIHIPFNTFTVLRTHVSDLQGKGTDGTLGATGQSHLRCWLKKQVKD